MNSSSVTQNPLETGCRGLFSAILVGTCQLRTFWYQPAVSTVGDDIFHLKTDKSQNQKLRTIYCDNEGVYFLPLTYTPIHHPHKPILGRDLGKVELVFLSIAATILHRRPPTSPGY
jgi:hypothetical protein